MGLLDTFRNSLLSWLFPGDNQTVKRMEAIELRRAYRSGKHKPQILTKPNGPDDNVYVNLIKLVTARSTALLVGKGIDWQLPGADKETSPEWAYLETTWRLNRRAILLHNAVTMASDAGSGFLRIVPNQLPDAKGDLYPRLIPLDPEIITEVKTLPNDKDVVIGYVIVYAVPNEKGENIGHKQEVNRIEMVNGTFTWETVDYEEQRGKWAEIAREVFADANGVPYNFAPIIHWQNLPDALNIWGEPDATDDIIILQNRLNFAVSNVGKIIRLYAHPQRYGKNLGKGDVLELGPDEMPNFTGDAASIEQLAAVGDLPGAVQYITLLIQSLFNTTRTVDLASLTDKLGALTNFALRVLYFDALQKLDTKRELFGEMILELNRRLLVISGLLNTDSGTMVWQRNVLPIDDVSEVAALKTEVDAGFMSTEDAIKQRGRDPKDVMERVAAEKQSATNMQQGNDLGAMLLKMREFNIGQTNQTGK